MKSLAIWVPGPHSHDDEDGYASTIDPLLRNLAKFSGLHSLCLDCTPGTTPAGYERYSERQLDPVSHLTSLTKLVVRGEQNSCDCMRDFARALHGLQSIRELEMSLPEDKECTESIVAVCAHMPGLSSLTLGCHRDVHMDEERGAGAIWVGVAGHLGRLTGLRTLDLSQCRVLDHSGRTSHALAASLERLPELRMLKLPELKALSDWSIVAVVRALSSYHSITSLALRLPGKCLYFGAHPAQEDLWATVCALSTLQDLTVKGPYEVLPMRKCIASGKTATNSALGSLSCLTQLCVFGDFSQYQLSGVSSLTCVCTLSVQCSGLCDEDMQELVCSLSLIHISESTRPY